MANYTVTLAKMMKKLSLTSAFLPKDAEEILISSKDITRPGLQLVGFTDHYDMSRIALIGNAEYYFLEQFDTKTKQKAMDRLFSNGCPAMIFSRDLTPLPEAMESAKKYSIPILISPAPTSEVLAHAITFLHSELAERVTKHGVLMEIYGEGVFIIGDSGVGKSENSIELINRGHRLVADDAVELIKLSHNKLRGSSPKNIRHFVELRGIGIINAMRTFGSGAVKSQQILDLIVNLEMWDKTQVYDRMGIESEVTDILGVKVPIVTIPVTPGRNLAVIIEVAAMNHRQKKMGYNAAVDLLNNLGMGYDANETPHERNIVW